MKPKQPTNQRTLTKSNLSSSSMASTSEIVDRLMEKKKDKNTTHHKL